MSRGRPEDDFSVPSAPTFETDAEDARLLLEASSIAVIELRPPSDFDELIAQGLERDPESGAVTAEATRLLRASEMTWLNESAVRILGATDKADAQRAFARWLSARAKEGIGLSQLMVDSLSEAWPVGDFSVMSSAGQTDVEMTWSSYRDDAGRLRFIATLHDVTEDMRVMRELANRQAELEAALSVSAVELEVTEKRVIATTELILALVELRDHYTSSHMRDAADLSDAIAERLECPAGIRAALNAAALVHDVGKLAVPSDLLSKSGALSPAEMRLMQEHARMGAELLESAGFEPDVVKIAAQHHERWDGSGYPLGLEGEAVSLGARILAVADTIVSMGYHRPYRAALPREVVYAEIESGAGVRYDPAVTAAALSVLDERWRS